MSSTDPPRPPRAAAPPGGAGLVPPEPELELPDTSIVSAGKKGGNLIYSTFCSEKKILSVKLKNLVSILFLMALKVDSGRI